MFRQMNTLMSRDEMRATIAAHGLWDTAVAYLDQASSVDPWERLQALQLLTHCAFLNPKDVDCGKCINAATRMCFQLGLQHELPVSDQTKLDGKTLDTRRRLFWNSYSIDA